MRLFSLSLESIAKSLKSTLVRFPLPLLVAVVITICGITLNHQVHEDIFGRLLLASVVLFPTSIALTLLLEKFQQKLIVQVLSYIVFAGGLLLYYSLLPSSVPNAPMIYMVYAFLLFGMGLVFMTVVPRNKIDTVYWEHVIRLLFNGIITVFCAICIYLAILVALWSIDLLFQVRWPNTLWMDIWFLVAGLFSPYFFLANIPVKTEEEKEPLKVAFALQWFTKFIALPASVIYFAILYAYSAKILVTGEWPNGQVATLVIWFSILALLCFVILYKKLVLLKRAALWERLFFVILLPQMGMLFWATWLRIDSVGVTESRYALIAGGIWITILTFYFLISRKRSLHFFSYTLLAIMIVSSIGPWSIGEVSKNSQVNELQELLVKNNVWKDGKATVPAETISDPDGTRIMNIVRYISETHTLTPIKSWFTDESKVTTEYIADFFKLPVYGGYGGTIGCYLSTDGRERNTVISGYDALFDYIGVNKRDYTAITDSITLNGEVYTLTTQKESLNVKVESSGQTLIEVPLTTVMADFLNTHCGSAQSGKTLSGSEMSYFTENDKVRVQFFFENIAGEKSTETDKPFALDNLSTKVLLDIK